MLMATITKKDPADRIAERSGASHVLTRRIVQELLDEIVAGLIKGSRSELRDFGVFSDQDGGGQKHVVVSLLLFMLHNRMVVAGPLYRNEKTGSIWAESDAAAITGPPDPGVGEGELDGARRLGERVARLATKMSRTN